MEFENLIKLIDTVSASELTGFKYEEKGLKLQMSKGDGEVKVVAAPAAPLPPRTGGISAWGNIRTAAHSETGSSRPLLLSVFVPKRTNLN